MSRAHLDPVMKSFSLNMIVLQSLVLDWYFIDRLHDIQNDLTLNIIIHFVIR